METIALIPFFLSDHYFFPSLYHFFLSSRTPHFDLHVINKELENIYLAILFSVYVYTLISHFNIAEKIHLSNPKLILLSLEEGHLLLFSRNSNPSIISIFLFYPTSSFIGTLYHLRLYSSHLISESLPPS